MRTQGQNALKVIEEMSELKRYLQTIPPAELIVWLTTILTTVEGIDKGWTHRRNPHAEAFDDGVLPQPLAKIGAALVDYEMLALADDRRAAGGQA